MMWRFGYASALTLILLAVNQAAGAERRGRTPGVMPQRHAGRVYAGVGLLTGIADVSYRWNPTPHEVLLMHADRRVILRAGVPVARVNGRSVRLLIAPVPSRRELDDPVPARDGRAEGAAPV